MTLDPGAIRLDGRVAVVTGSAMGIGEGIARSFGRFGARLALCDRDPERLAGVAESIEAEGGEVMIAVFDVREGASVREFFETIGARYGEIDILVNNVGGGFHAPMLEISPKGEQALVAENFTSVTQCVRAAVPLMGARGGTIINLTSIEAHRAAPGYAIYSAMKAAVENLTRTLALELGGRQIRVNCIAPDMIPTPGIGDVFVDTPIARRGSVDDVAGAALFLASDLSRFVTGSTLHVDGGGLAAGGWRRRADGNFALD